MIIGTDEETAAVGAKLAAQARRRDVIAISGPLGVGKTTLVRGYLAALGYPDEVPSPSFAIVQPYEALDPPAWHVDLYRLEPAEVDDLGLDELVGGEGIVAIEWAERWRERPDDAIEVRIEDRGEERREIRIT